MTKHILMGMLSIVVLTGALVSVAFSALPSPVVAAEYPWELRKDEDGVRAYVRKVEGSSILEYKGIVTVDAGVEEAVRLFEDDGRVTEWFYQCSQVRRIKTNTPEDKVFYFVIAMPWPVQDRDLVFRRVRSKDPVTGAVEYRTSSVPEIYPEQNGKTRMPYLKGLWRFTPLADGRTAMYYQQHSEVGGHIPVWLVNKLAVNIPFASLSRFRQLLSKVQTGTASPMAGE